MARLFICDLCGDPIEKGHLNYLELTCNVLSDSCEHFLYHCCDECYRYFEKIIERKAPEHAFIEYTLELNANNTLERF